jgi:hypothetical protein
MEIYFNLTPEIPLKFSLQLLCDVNFSKEFPFWLHKILLSGLLKNIKELPKRQFSFEAGAECEDYLGWIGLEGCHVLENIGRKFRSIYGSRGYSFSIQG